MPPSPSTIASASAMRGPPWRGVIVFRVAAIPRGPSRRAGSVSDRRAPNQLRPCRARLGTRIPLASRPPPRYTPCRWEVQSCRSRRGWPGGPSASRGSPEPAQGDGRGGRRPTMTMRDDRGRRRAGRLGLGLAACVLAGLAGCANFDDFNIKKMNFEVFRDPDNPIEVIRTSKDGNERRGAGLPHASRRPATARSRSKTSSSPCWSTARPTSRSRGAGWRPSARCASSRTRGPSRG